MSSRCVILAVVLGAANVPGAVLAQGTVTVTVGKTSGDSLEAARQRAHEDTLAFRADSAEAAHDSLVARRMRANIIPLTPALLATAFRDPRARPLLARARETRLAQDSSLTSYDATTYERFSIGMGMGRFVRDRLLFRTERATRVRWDRQTGAVIDVTGLRSAAPALGSDADVKMDNRVPLPYFPGRDALWVGSGLARANVGDRTLVNPLAAGAEAYYTYTTGDSLVLQLPDRHPLVVRELRVQPRAPGWRVVVGSLWFDVASGQLVRAVYRMAEPIDLTPDFRGDNGERGAGSVLARLLTPTITAQISVVTVEYGLFDGRFWLPRTQTAEGEATAGAFRLPVQIQQHFEYAGVNGALQLHPVQVNPLDTASGVAGYVARDTARRGECKDTAALRSRSAVWYDRTLPVLIRTPCDTVALARSPTLPPSIYSSTDTLFGDQTRAALVADALGLQQQPAWDPRRPTVRYGVTYTRYNRVEGLAPSVDVQQIYGGGYTGHAVLRFGFADRSPTGELALTRSNGRESLTLGAYRRLAVANDWGNPLGFGASLTALLFGRDDGIYYHTWGGEITHEQSGGLFDQWRLFAEQESDAATHTNVSLPNVLGDHHFRDRLDIDATNGNVVGLALRRHGTLGEDPDKFRALSDLRLEAATGSFDYVRGMLDLALDRPLTKQLGGTLTLSGGTSGGHLPTQRLWYLGGPYTVRGQPTAGAAGDAYWFARAELGGREPGFRPFVFADLGWAGSRSHWTTEVQPISGGGVGASMLDGLLHIDIAKGIHPTRGAQLDAYLGTRF